MTDTSIKPDRWSFDPGLVAPDFQDLARSAVGIWPMWNSSSLVIPDISRFRNDGTGTFSAGTGIITDEFNPVTFYDGNDFVDTGVERIGGTGLFCDSGEKFTVISRFRNASDVTGTIVSRASGTAGNRTFQLFMGTGASSPSFNIRGNGGGLSWGLDDDEYHTVYFTWDGTAAQASHDGLVDQETIAVGTASEDTGENIIFGARTGGTAFTYQDGHIDFVYIFDRAISNFEILTIEDNIYGLFRNAKPRVIGLPIAPVGGNLFVVPAGVGGLSGEPGRIAA